MDLNQALNNCLNNKEYQSYLNSKEYIEHVKLVRDYSDKQIWNNKPLMKVIKRLSDE